MQVFTKENMTWCPDPVLVTVASRPKCSISLPLEPLKWTLESLIPVLAILGILLHLLLTLPAPLFCSKLQLASDPLSLSALVLALRVWWWNLASPYWTSGTLWEQFAHPSSHQVCLTSDCPGLLTLFDSASALEDPTLPSLTHHSFSWWLCLVPKRG